MLKVALNAQLNPTKSGGIATFLGALIAALAELEDSDEQYLLVGNRRNAAWLESIKGGNQSVVLADIWAEQQMETARGLVRKFFRPVLGPVKRALIKEMEQGPSGQSRPRSYPVPVPISSGFWEELECDVVHFPFQSYLVCGKPTIFNPHDLQHLHFPENFAAGELAIRESVYRAGCQFSHVVVTASQWVKDDIKRHYATHSDKIQVIPWGSPTEFYREPGEADLNRCRQTHRLPDRFLIYPAKTWPHKNHLTLIEALALLRESESLNIPVVCTGGAAEPHQSVLNARIRELQLEDQVRFLGYVTNDELRSLYKLATAVVVPTLFEAVSGPVFEAWNEGKPVACSTVTSLPEQVRNAALLFDAHSAEDTAMAVKAIFTDQALREGLTEKGFKRLQDFSWRRTAKAYRAVYRQVARRPLSEEDTRLLSWDWMKNPEGVDSNE